MSQNLNTQVAKQKPVTDSVLATINNLQETGELVLPQNYSAPNALKAAWIVLQDTKDRNGKSALEVCSRTSVSKALFQMVTKGLSVAKKQCYFVVYGNELQCPESYFGTVMIAKRDANVKTVAGQVIYKNDEFKYGVDIETGLKKIISHETSLDNIDNDNIVGAYAIITYNDGTTKAEVMNMIQIRKAWMQGATKGNSPAHKNFPDQMAIRTVINRALKLDNASSDDSHLSIPVDDGSAPNQATSAPKEEIEEIHVEDVEVVEEAQPTTESADEGQEPNKDVEPEF